MRKVAEFVKKHPVVASSTAATLLFATCIEVAAIAKNRTYSLPEEYCISPTTASGTYSDPEANLWLNTYTGIGTAGVLAEGVLPEQAYGVQASFKVPSDGAEAWDDNASNLIKPDDLGQVAMKMAVGDGDVQFGVRIVAPEGSELCESEPDISFEFLDESQYPQADGKLPWLNPVNGVVDTFD